MPKSSLEELRGRVSAGEYTVDPRVLAEDLLSKFALIRKVRVLLSSEDADGAYPGAKAALQVRMRRRTRPGVQASRRAQNASRRHRPE